MAGVVTAVHSATTVFRAAWRASVTCLALRWTSVMLMSVTVMILASVHAR